MFMRFRETVGTNSHDFFFSEIDKRQAMICLASRVQCLLAFCETKLLKLTITGAF